MMNTNGIIDPTTGDLLELSQLLKTTNTKLCRYRVFNELACLSQSSKKQTIKGTNTIDFILPDQKPTNKESAYTQIVVRFQPQKKDSYRVQITIEGEKIHCAGKTFTPNANITTSKCLFNSISSTKFSKLLGLGIKDFYFNTAMNEYEYMWIPRWIPPQDYIDEN